MIGKALVAMALATAASAAEVPDPYLWLESVDSPRAMAWVEARNAYTTRKLEADPAYAANYAAALAIGGAKDRIPTPEFVHGAIYNFWQDADHLRGIWRTTTLEDYRVAQPNWRTVLDIDALGKAEGKSWVWKGTTCLEPDQRRCLVALSDGGEDAITVREFDVVTGRFVDGGFTLPHGKQEVAWEDADHILVAREWTPGELTTSGYAYVVKRVTRGQPLSAAVEVFRGDKADTLVSPATYVDGDGRRLTLITRARDFFHFEYDLVDAKGTRRLALPLKSTPVGLVAGRVVVRLDEAWSAGGANLPSGALAAVDLAAAMRDPAALAPSLVWAPGPRDALEDAATTRDRLLVSTLDNVRGRAWSFAPTANGWRKTPLPVADNMAIRLGDTDRRMDRAFLTVSGFLTPPTLSLVDTAAGTLTAVKSLPAKFDASGAIVEQHEAVSSDGTRIPYFIVHRRDLKLDGQTPTLLTAYGGFQVSRTPDYSATTGKLWIEKGGALVLANIRGGGEFGPAWHEAGLGVKRQIIYDDFAAVGRDLIARKITSPRRLGIEGGSNGGLLMGVQFTQHPELWHAVIIDVPLLDMIRIGKIAAGASWAGEYGDVDTDPVVRAFWEKTSPYQNLKAGVAYPEPFIFTTTKDDRVGPQHARKFAARLEELGYHFYFYENTEGGHGAGADLKQAARTTALEMTYLQAELMDR
ncbi:MAG: S9 family peptidase [Sphingomonadaceae bacterium]|nr:S9 family peptidase [Sphingomonadaceae bacterium]